MNREALCRILGEAAGRMIKGVRRLPGPKTSGTRLVIAPNEAVGHIGDDGHWEVPPKFYDTVLAPRVLS